MSHDDRVAVVQAYVGDRTNRRHKPGRALERLSYRFDVLSDYGAFRDLQRHRLLTIEWQDLTPRHGFVRPEAGGRRRSDGGATTRPWRSRRQLHDDLREPFPHQASYAVSLAYRVRYVMQMNAREAMHLIELRSAPQGHPSYRDVAQDMHHLIADVAGHRAVAEMMRFVDHSDEAASSGSTPSVGAESARPRPRGVVTDPPGDASAVESGVERLRFGDAVEVDAPVRVACL